ncbi:MAG: helix-turn-helix domain-containing protein [Microthrixaceae bacterium]
MQARTPDRLPGARRRLAPEERRAELLEIAGELFLTHGSSFTAAQLAVKAGVSEGTVFRYFPDMESLIAAARRQAIGLQTLLPQFREALQHPTLELRLQAAGRAITVRMIQTIRLIEETSTPARRPQSSEVTEVLDALAPLFLSAGGEGGGAGERDRSVQLAAIFLGMFVSNSVLTKSTLAPPMDVDEIVSIFIRGAMNPTANENSTTSEGSFN